MAHPIAFPSATITYTLTVTDDSGYVSTDAITVTIKYISRVGAGNDVSICKDSWTTLGSTYNVTGQGISYHWAPSLGLDNDSIPRPMCVPTVTTTYTLTATMAGCAPKIDYVTVTVVDVEIEETEDKNQESRVLYLLSPYVSKKEKHLVASADWEDVSTDSADSNDEREEGYIMNIDSINS